MELKVGMYVRTKDGEIFECYVGEQMGKPIYYPKNSKTNGFIYYDEICSISKDLIDLIEEGDYVNGYRVYSGGENHFDYILTWDEERDYYMKIELPSVDIKSIVTKEQFNSVKYEVE